MAENIADVSGLCLIDLFLPEVTIKRSRPINAPPQSNLPRMNDRIRISPIRVVSATGEMLGEMETLAALRIAQDEGLLKKLVVENPP